IHRSAIPRAIGDLGNEAGGICVRWIHLESPARRQGRRFHIATAEIGGRDPHQVAFLPAMKKVHADHSERDKKNRTDEPSDQELDQPPFVSFGLDFQFG
ncbi:MAG TPA: hypothetical protein VK581_04635, partial [Chthoniobacterales bacterium]|nr:hypothetical protein [Chthoniobacterales bacterium]